MNIYTITWDPVQGSTGYLVEYRKSGTSNWVTPASPANPTLYTHYALSIDGSFGYDVRVSSQGASCMPSFRYVRIPVTCQCAAGYTIKIDGSGCFKEESMAPTILSSDYCFAASTLTNDYAYLGTKLIDAGYPTDLSGSFTLLTNTPLWKDTTGQVTGPFNRRGLWVDTDCNGSKDALTAGGIVQITHLITLTSSRSVYIGIAGDNQFKVTINGITVAQRSDATDVNNFRYWYLFPVTLSGGNNYITFSGVGDGSVNDALAAAIYDSTRAELLAATSDSDLAILFDTKDLICTTPPSCPKVNIASCDAGWFLDTSGGVGNYHCKRVLTLGCGESTTTTTTTTIPPTTTTTTTVPVTTTSSTTTTTTTAGV